MSLWFRVPGGHFCRSEVFHFVGEDLSVAFVWLGSSNWGIVYWGHGFSLLWHGGHPRLLVVWSMLLVPREPPLVVAFVVSFVRVGSLGVSLFS